MYSSSSLTTPVVFVIFNRPANTKTVFEQIRKAKPLKLYIIGDAPRPSVVADLENCLEARNIVEAIDWDCQVFRNYSEKNLGCGVRIHTGLDWVFENEERAIILEDDCVPSLSFFTFCTKLLNLYNDDTRIMHISGERWNLEFKRNANSFFFSRYSHIWGWATWKRAWKLYDFEMKLWPEIKNGNYLKDIFQTKREISHWTKQFDSYYYKQEKTGWAIQWLFTVLINNGLCVVPNANLISNIGVDGVHSSTISRYHFRPIEDNFEIIRTPEFVIEDKEFDRYHFEKHIYHDYKIINKIKKRLLL
jgi:hypothetical protein